MLRNFRDAPIKSKLNTVVMLTSCTVLLLSTIAYGIYDFAKFKADMVEDLLIISKTIGMNSTASIMFNDREAARETLSSLSADEHITFAMIIKQDRSIFAHYSRNDPDLAGAEVKPARLDYISYEPGNDESHQFTDTELKVTNPVKLDDDFIGEVVIWKDLAELDNLKDNYINMSAIFLVVFLYMAYILSSRLQVLISGPIIKLNEVMKEVSEQGNFSLRATKESDDEVGALIDGFNEMVSHIEARDEKLQKHGDMLEKEVAKRTGELESANEYLEKAVAELLDAKIAAEAASKAKSQFLANVSHEVRTPMHGMLGMAELLHSTDLNSNQRNLVETITKSGRALLNIINDILDFSKIEAGKLTLESAEFDLYQAVEEVADLYSADAFGKGIELIYNIRKEVPQYVVGDVNRLIQVISNLLNNAIKFTSEGEVLLEVEQTRALGLTREGSCMEVELCCTVTDTGIGIPEESMDTMFESFTQVDGSLRRSYGGTGLGLSIVKQLAELMGGKVGVKSELGKGSKVWFTFRAGVAEGRGTPADLTRNDFKQARVIAVDDNATNRHFIKQVLSNWGIEAGMAGSGGEALDMLSAAAESGKPYEIAILDMMMPGMDGGELSRRIKGDPALSPIDIIILSSTDLSGDEGLGSIAQCMLTKPVRQSQLYSCIATIMFPSGRAAGEKQSHDEEYKDIRLPEGCRILVAEDNPVNQLVAEQMLISMGGEVHVVDNGLAALAAIEQNDYNMIFMDCQMPKMDGFEATAKIREGERTGRYPRRNVIVALTAHAMKSDKARCIKAGMDDYLSKPFSKADMMSMVGKLLKDETGGTNTGHPSAAGEYTDEEAGTAGTAANNGCAPAQAAPDGPVDPRYLEPLRKLDQENRGRLMDKIVATYLGSSKELLEGLGAAVPEGDSKKIRATAHSLKSSSHQVGAVRLAGLSKKMEFMGRDEILDGSAELLDEMRSEYDKVGQYLKDLVEGGEHEQNA